MKKVVYSSANSVQDLRKKISEKLVEFIKYELWEQQRLGYFKGLRRQFTVNGRKYVVKNDAHDVLHILTPEGTDLYGYKIPNYIDGDTTDNMALDMINDAFGENIDLEMKKMYVKNRVNYRYHTPGYVYCGKYLDKLRRYYTEDGSSGRYAVTTIKSTWSSSDVHVTWFDDENEAIRYAEDFINDGAKSHSIKQDFEYKYTYYASVIDSEIGEEIYTNESESLPAE